MPDTIPDYDAQLRTEFRDQLQDRLASCNEILTGLRDARGDAAAFPLLSRDTQNIKGLAGGYGYPVIGMVAQRLETYLAGLQEVTPRVIEDIQTHLDQVGDLMERAEQPDPATAAQLLQALPARYSFDVGDVVVKRIEIMLVTPSRVVAKLVGNELAACGFKPVVVHDPLEAFAQAVRVPPGMILASVVMEPLNGVELVRALKLVRATQACPMAVLTSLEADNRPLHELPPDVAVVHTGANFGSDFATVTAKFNLG